VSSLIDELELEELLFLFLLPNGWLAFEAVCKRLLKLEYYNCCILYFR
jgi:hypothetical protein